MIRCDYYHSSSSNPFSSHCNDYIYQIGLIRFPLIIPSTLKLFQCSDMSRFQRIRFCFFVGISDSEVLFVRYLVNWDSRHQQKYIFLFLFRIFLYNDFIWIMSYSIDKSKMQCFPWILNAKISFYEINFTVLCMLFQFEMEHSFSTSCSKSDVENILKFNVFINIIYIRSNSFNMICSPLQWHCFKIIWSVSIYFI